MSHPNAPRPVPLALMRLTVTTHALAIFAQPVLAGLFLNGDFDMVEVHGVNAVLVQLLGLVQIPAAILLRWPGRGPQWPIWASVLLFLAEGTQVTLGYTRTLSVHVPLGVAVVAIASLMLRWVWRPRLGRPGPNVSDREVAGHATVAP